jgi:hypothetical protein
MPVGGSGCLPRGSTRGRTEAPSCVCVFFRFGSDPAMYEVSRGTIGNMEILSPDSGPHSPQNVSRGVYQSRVKVPWCFSKAQKFRGVFQNASKFRGVYPIYPTLLC